LALTDWPKAPEMTPYRFAATLDAAFADRLDPMQLIPEAQSAYPVLSVSPAPDCRFASAAYASFLKALDFYNAPFYDRGDVRVYIDVESGRSCTFSPDGAMHYINPTAKTKSADTPAGAVLTAWEALRRLSPSALGDAYYEVCSVTQTETETTVSFALTANGIPLLTLPAVVVVRNAVVVEIACNLLRVSATGDAAPPLTLLQTAALLPEGAYQRLELRYVLGDGGVATADWTVAK